MSQLVALLVILPLLVAVVAVLFWRHPLIQRALALLTSTAVLGLGLTLLFTAREQGPQVTQLGNWPAPFGIVLVADLLSTLMVSATAVIAVASLGLTLVTAQRQQEQYLHPLFLLLLAGVNGAFLTGDIFNLFVFFEVTLIATYALMSIGGRALQMEGAFKYVVINLIASALFLIGVGLLYGLMGTLNMAHLSVRVAQAEDTALLTAVATLLLVAFSIKAAIIPFHFWLPG
ncbi:MAG: proton-conducting transporter membrane subunit, partial [Dehalococcoidia bacterium]